MPAPSRADLPSVIVTSGEPAGIGPDLCLALAARDLRARLVIAGDPELLAARAVELGLRVQLETVAAAGPAPHRQGTLQVLPFPVASAVTAGRLDPANARYVLDMLAAAADGCRAGRYRAMITAPVQKSTINDAGVPFSGHTEYLAERLGAPHPVMLLVAAAITTCGVLDWVAMLAVASAEGVMPKPASTFTLSFTTNSCARRLVTSGMLVSSLTIN